MIAKTEAVPIRISPFGGTSQIVTWLTQDFGKISTTIKGAQRPKRIGGGQYDLGYRCELLFYEREINGLHVFKDCMALEHRSSIRGKWRETAILSYLCLVAGSATVPFQQIPVLYQTFLTALDAIEANAPLLLLTLWFELQVLKLHGTTPQFQACTICRCPATSAPYLFATRAGGLVCRDCTNKRALEVHNLSADTVTLLQQLQRLPRPIPATHAGNRRTIPSECHRAMEDFLHVWLDFPQKARPIALQMAEMRLSKS
jgi:DNA repair protein RecO (recombination protein O)